MKLVVVEFAGRGGMIHYAFQLCRAMSRAGADVTLVTDRDHYELEGLPHPFTVLRHIGGWDPKPAGSVSNAPAAVVFRKARRLFRAVRYYSEWLRIVGLVRRLRPDIVQLGDIRFPFDLFPLLLLRGRAPILADICHNVHPFAAGGRSAGMFDRSPFVRFFYRRIYRLFDVVFVHYERNRRELEKTFGVRQEHTGVIMHGNESIFEELRAPAFDGAALRRRLGVPEEAATVVFFGTLSRYKGTDVLLQAFREVHHRTGARLILAGYPFHDFDVDAHRRLAKDAGIGDAVTWVPEYVPSSEVAAWMEAADVMVFPYRDISQSGAIHVAQTFGVPIVASAIGAMQDVVEHERSGLLVPPENPPALAAAILRLLRDRELARRLGNAAAEDARSRFSWESNAAVMLERYEAVGSRQ